MKGLGDRMRKEIQEMIDKIDRGEHMPYKVIKGRVPITNGEEDWDQAEFTSTEERVLCPETANAKNH